MSPSLKDKPNPIPVSPGLLEGLFSSAKESPLSSTQTRLAAMSQIVPCCSPRKEKKIDENPLKRLKQAEPEVALKTTRRTLGGSIIRRHLTVATNCWKISLALAPGWRSWVEESFAVSTQRLVKHGMQTLLD